MEAAPLAWWGAVWPSSVAQQHGPAAWPSVSHCRAVAWHKNHTAAGAWHGAQHRATAPVPAAAQHLRQRSTYLPQWKGLVEAAVSSAMVRGTSTWERGPSRARRYSQQDGTTAGAV